MSDQARQLLTALRAAPHAASRDLRRRVGLTRRETARAWHELGRAGLVPNERHAR